MIHSREGGQAFCRIRLFGSLHLIVGQDIAVRFGGRKAGVLLARLALFPGRPQGREFLAETLWPNSKGSAARTNLRFVLNSLRKELESANLPPETLLSANHTTIELKMGVLTTDVEQFENELSAAHDASLLENDIRLRHLTNAIHLYQGDLLVDYYDDWISLERERLRENYRAALIEAAMLLEKDGDIHAAVEYVRTSISCDPLREDSYLHLIRLQIELGDSHAALHEYYAMESLFLKELKCAPSPAARLYLPIIRNLKRRPRFPETATPVSIPLPAKIEAPSFALPRPLTTFFERKECEEVLQTIRQKDIRLLTLTGPSGSGKTRIAIETGNALLGDFGNAIWFMPTAEYDRIEALADAICDALHLQRSTVLEEFAEDNHLVPDSFQREPSLLILDGFEHLAASGSALVRNLVQRAPWLTCLVTSCNQLRLSGELVIELPSLGIPRTTDSDEQICLSESYRMLVDRIRMVRPQFTPSPMDNTEIAEICRRLEGLPLSIELAAPWMQVLSPKEIVKQLADPLSFLVSDNTDIPEAHRSLLSAIQRSYDLLPDHLQSFFRNLSVFESGFTLDAVKTVLDQAQSALFLRQLREYSLMHSIEQGTQNHFYLQDSVRKFAWNLLSEEEHEELSARHSEYYLHLAFESESQIGEAGREEWFAELDIRMPNFRRALDWCFLRSPQQYVYLSSALWLFWYLNGHIHEGQTRLQQAMLLSADFPDLDMAAAKACLGLACLAYTQGNPDMGHPLLRQGLDQFRRMRYSGGTAHYLSGLAKYASLRGDYSLARLLLEESLSLWHDTASLFLDTAIREDSLVIPVRYSGNEVYGEIAENARRLGDVAYCEGNLDIAKSKYQDGLNHFQALCDLEGIAATHTGLAVVARAYAHYDTARHHIYQSLRIRTRQENRRGIATAQRILAGIESREGKISEARGWIKECLTTLSTQTNVHGLTGILTVAGTVDLYEGKFQQAVDNLLSAVTMAEQQGDSRRAAYGRCFLALALLSVRNSLDMSLVKKSLYWFYESGDRGGLALSLEVIAAIVAVRGDDIQAACYFNTAASVRGLIQVPVPPAYQVIYDRHLQPVRCRMGSDAFHDVPILNGGDDFQAVVHIALR